MPAPYEGFGGTIRSTMARSEPWWPTAPTPPSGAPNVVVILVDDVGFSDIGCFGGEIATPNIDRLAAAGVRLANFHVNPMCSPTRASLLTGLNCHNVGVGHVAQDDPGFPGYYGELAEDVVTAAEIFRDQGYATLMVGKWHLARDADLGPSGPKHSWPCQRGFDRFYGILDAFTNLHQPHELVQDNTHLQIDTYPDGYYLTDDLTDQAITMIKERKAARPDQPFFLYFAHPAAHAPLMAKRADIERYVDTYGVGWDAVRATRHQRQIELGIIAPGTALPPRNSEPGDDVVAWDSLSADEQVLYARYMAVYAAMVDSIDQSLGRVRAELEAMGEWDNTIVVFHSDNGASREGQAGGTSNYYAHLSIVPRDDDEFDLDFPRLDELGGPTTMTHYPRGWAMVGNTPYRLYKQNTHAGGHQVPCVWHWPNGLSAAAEIRGHYGHVTDVLPTLLDLIGLSAPTHRHGREVKAIQGHSLAAVLRSSDAPPAHTEQYYELQGHRNFTRDGWEVVTRRVKNTNFTDADWELYHLDTDPVEMVDLATQYPERVAELAAGFDQAAWANQVYPLDEGSGWRWLVRRPEDAAFEQPVVIRPGTPTLNRWRCNRLVWNRSVHITVSFVYGAHDAGVLVAHGDQGGGYVLYVEDGDLRFAYNDGHGHTTVVDAGSPIHDHHQIRVDLLAPGKRRWNVVISEDQRELARLDDLPMLFPMAPFEGINVGIDRRSPVSWELHRRHGSFAYSGRIDSVRYEPGELPPDGPGRYIEMLKQMGSKYE